jgi:CheY-like chemotaxis protein
MHLLVNAAQAMPEGRADENMLRVVTTTAATKRAVVEVHDTGGGIPEDAIRRIFDPFFTTRGVGEGVGLGLSVCHGTVLSFGGHIEVESEVGKGTVFRITLPPAPIPPPPPSAEGLGPPSAPFSADDLGDPDQPVLRRGKVLLVDDDDLVGITLTRALRKEHDVTLTTNGKQALDLLVSGERFDVILCDLMMPVMTGMALYAELTARVPDAVSRIVFVTGGAFTSSAEAFLGRVKNERLEKPFDRKSLRDLVRKYVA